MSDAKFKLIKCSLPDWEREYDTREQLVDALHSHICDSCRADLRWEDQNGKHESKSIWDMLATSCGCEYHVEGVDE